VLRRTNRREAVLLEHPLGPAVLLADALLDQIRVGQQRLREPQRRVAEVRLIASGSRRDPQAKRLGR
jgi:hypothetical protein